MLTWGPDGDTIVLPGEAIHERYVRKAREGGGCRGMVDLADLRRVSYDPVDRYRLAISVHPAWLLSFWYGPDTTWSSVQTAWFRALLIMKMGVLPLALVTIWLTLWAKQLRKRAEGSG